MANILKKSAQHQNFGLKLTGNYKLPSLEKAYIATGHNSAFVDDDGRMYLVYHTRFNDNGEGHSPRVHQMLVNEDGWPCVSCLIRRRERLLIRMVTTSMILSDDTML